MAINAYLTLAAQKQGDIKGGVTQKGREGTIAVHAFNVQISSPRDAASGLATGRRQHEPIRILKDVDKSTPLLWSALVNNETLTSWVLEFYAPAPNGIEQQVYTVSLTNASIASISESLLDNQIAANTSIPLREEITFTYQKITWTWNDGGITASDDWSSAVT